MPRLKNPKWEKFCKLFASEEEFFGNGTQSYIKAFKIKSSSPGAYKSAMASASRLLRNVKICDRINELLEEQALNNNFVDKQLGFLITQFADFKSKLGAIKEYNQLKKRITEKKEITFKDKSNEDLAKEVAEALINILK